MLLLIAAIILFTLSAAFSLYSLQKTSKLVSRSLPLTIWAVGQLEREYADYWLNLSLYSAGTINRDDLIVSYEILWNRLDIVLSSDEAIELRELKDTEEVIHSLFSELKATEDIHYNLAAYQDPAARKLMQRFSHYQQQLHNIALVNFMDRDQLYGLDLVSEAFRTFGLYMAGLFFSGSILVFLLVREGRRSQHNALHDSLTTLPNRAHFVAHLNRVIALARRENRCAAVLLIDLNDFKAVNDTLGHNAGDQLLQGIADRLNTITRDSDLTARLGGDEFAIVQYPVNNREEVAGFASRLSATLGQEMMLSDGRCTPSASIGISLYPEHSQQAQQLLINADMAMYQAKQQKLGSSNFYDDELLSIQQRRKQLGHDLRSLLSTGPESQLRLAYQPVVDLASEQIVATEALLRWQHPELGAIPPQEAIEIAEHYGLADNLGKWILHSACRQLAEWHRHCGDTDFRISVNISPGMYRCGNLESEISSLLAEHNIPASKLMLEVTEDTTMQDLGYSSRILQKLGSLGIQVAMDDFGTGHSSLSHLSQLPVNVLKIDRSFILAWSLRQEDLSVLRAIIQLGKTLNLVIVAEGIETAEDKELLRKEGCELGQGFYFSRPVSAEQITALLEQQAGILES
ncbi:putative bifunctional diguanylate cyclase/phosphodiesterase [Marinobacterium jannaschii]|uniref:putative bifunctional diguanylate cyclase/phosphodiesterase n=1 Tax=Marinobacterium jannaschii TaxID=64970 RepID=UPI001470CAE3|nr:EAL domain-containing protein [Marinobacterium jannaschii]